MDKKIILTTKAPAPIGPYSQAVLVGNTLYCSGQIALDSLGKLHTENIEVETTQIMKNINEVLQAANMSFDNIVKTTIFLTDMNDFAKVNEIYAKSFNSDYPARETVQVSALPKGVHVEISVIATQ